MDVAVSCVRIWSFNVNHVLQLWDEVKRLTSERLLDWQHFFIQAFATESKWKRVKMHTVITSHLLFRQLTLFSTLFC